ncbi:lipoprotein [Rhodoferax sp. BAB1]|uniref:LPS translocon maturation chaperone LptM n=1 Tax=Rhodoferax sp. BAB1 TaxID=2741720 RepID=UPI0015769642|nr:lipoprotein [Rhodoferax sp. BAB1]QKO22849.1 lipoprotein [Rhodoferax sp. BAB1]
MLQSSRILVRPLSHTAFAVIATIASLALAGCGQTGNLYLPTEPAAAKRATLPQSMWPAMPDRKKPGTPATPPTPSQPSAPAPVNAPAVP